MFKPGDVLLFCGRAWTFKNLMSKCIRLVTGNEITHVALYLKPFEDKHVILEALSNGVLIQVLTTAELYYKSNGDRLQGISRLLIAKDKDLSQVFTHAYPYHGKKYAYLTDVNLLLQHGKTRIFPKRPWTIWFKSDKSKFICSEVTQLVLEKALMELNVNPPFLKIPALTEPDDYLNTTLWEVTVA